MNVCNDLLRTVYEELKATELSGNGVYDLWPMITDSIRDFLGRQIDITGSEGKAWVPRVSGLPRGDVTMRE